MKKLLYLVLLLLYACSVNKISDDAIIIDTNKFNNCDELKQYIDSVSYIYIKPIEGIDLEFLYKPRVRDNYIYLCDPSFTRSIYKFDMSGNVIFYISKYGKSKEEYLEITDFIVADELIYVWDKTTRKITAFSNKTGGFVNSFHVPDSFDILCSIKNDVVTYDDTDYFDNYKNKIVTYDSIGNVLSKAFPIVDIDKKFAVGLLPKHMIDYNNEIYFISNYDYKIYKMDNNNYSVFQTFDFGKNNVTESYIRSRFNKDGIGLDKDIQEDNLASINSFSISENIMFVDYSLKNFSARYVKIGDKEYNFKFGDFVKGMQGCFNLCEGDLYSVNTKTLYMYDKDIDDKIVTYFERDDTEIIPPVIKIVHLKIPKI